ncbi:DUF1330 domain-containing protein [Ekhidna sp. To15]|uniref:DUF1330 domain-containing protein n=1 Tax=Ekhidna sp. To15 TaxID=3395267 RepID=UPI003F524462
MKKYILSTDEIIKEFYEKFKDKKEITMLNLLRYNEVADYSPFPDLAPHKPISGENAYAVYTKLVLPIMQRFSGKVRFIGKSERFLIGPQEETWHAVLLVEYTSVHKFLSFIQSEDYQKISHHRTAALENSRLLPIEELK